MLLEGGNNRVTKNGVTKRGQERVVEIQKVKST
jgi:hypothetical protein